MKIVIYERTAQNRGEIEFIRETLAPGLSACGDDVEISLAKYVECDVAVILWSPRNGSPERARAARAVRNLHGKNLLIFETPVIRAIKQWHFRVGFDHVHRGGRFCPAIARTDRAKAMGLTLAPWKPGAAPVIIAGQLPGDFSLDGVDITEWVTDVADHVQRVSRRPLIIRPHPFDYSPDWLQGLRGARSGNFARALAARSGAGGTWIAYTSGSAVDAVMAGVPTICMSEANFAWDVSAHSLASLDKPWIGDRSQWLENLAHCAVDQRRDWRRPVLALPAKPRRNRWRRQPRAGRGVRRSATPRPQGRALRKIRRIWRPVMHAPHIKPQNLGVPFGQQPRKAKPKSIEAVAAQSPSVKPQPALPSEDVSLQDLLSRFANPASSGRGDR